jgi:hypothetical protein
MRREFEGISERRVSEGWKVGKFKEEEQAGEKWHQANAGV